DPPPEMGQGIDARFILGMAKLGERVSILLDMEKVIGDGGGGILQKEEGDEGDKGEG
ncbi:MAG: chemotaxis protein CheW, partial [Deltaproteobacteria bacterium]